MKTPYKPGKLPPGKKAGNNSGKSNSQNPNKPGVDPNVKENKNLPSARPGPNGR